MKAKISDHIIKILWDSAIVFFFMFSMILVDRDMVLQSFVSLGISVAMAYLVVFSTQQYRKKKR